MADGAWFERACRIAVRVWPIDARRERGRRARASERVRALEARVREAERAQDADPSPVTERALQRVGRERDRAKRVLEQPAFHRAVEFAQLRVSLPEVLRLGRMSAVVAAVGSLVLLASLAAVRAPPSAMALGTALAAAAPVTAYVGVVSFPEALARRLRIASLGGAPEAVNYMAMSMRLVPALDRAIEFAAHHAEEPLATRLRSLLWDVYLRSPPGVEAAFQRFARDWGEWYEDVKRAFFAIASAALERSEVGLERALEKARQIAFEGTKARVQEYAASLRGPTTVLFALGVLLPLIVGAMLPLLALGGVSPTYPLGSAVRGGPDLTIPTVIAIDVVFPLAAFGYAFRILGNRPGTGGTRATTSPLLPRRAVVAAAIGLAAVPVVLLVPGPAGTLGGLWLLALGPTAYLAPGLREARRRSRASTRLEAELPDALFLLGNRVAEGVPLERALEMTAEAMRGSEPAALFEAIVRRLRTSRESIEEILFGASGVLEEAPSRSVHAALRMVLEVSRKDADVAGKAIVETSTYLRDLREADREIRRDLGSVVDAMRSTALLFAPIVLGVTCALYGLLTRSFADLVVVGLSPASFLGAVGVYLLLSVAVITYFSVGVAQGRDPLEFRAQLARGLPVGLAVFTLSYLVAQAGLA